MSYTKTTTHFQWPLPEETDLFNGLDDNQMKEELDEKIYNLEQQSTGDHEAVEALTGRVTEVEQTVSGYNTRIEELEGTVGEHAERLINLTNRQTELSRRLNGKAGESTIAAEYNEEESYSVGDFVYYGNILYKCTVASATPAGEFNSDNWAIAILTDELGGSTPGSIAAVNVSFDDAVAQLGANNAQAAIVALKTLIDNIGGSGMVLDFSTKQVLTAGTAITTQKEGLLVFNYFCTDNTSAIDCTVDGESVRQSTFSTDSANLVTIEVPLKAGSVILLSGTGTAAGRGAYFVEKA